MVEEEMALKAWFHVSFNDNGFYIDKEAPGFDHVRQYVQWKEIMRVVFIPAEDWFMCDEIYIFTHERPESYVIPTETDGALDLWNEIIRRNLFPAELAIKAATSTYGMFVWPPEEKIIS